MGAGRDGDMVKVRGAKRTGTRAAPPPTVPAGPVPTGATQRRFLQRTRARRWKTLRTVLLALAAVALVAGVAWLVFFSSVLAVTGVEVRGTDVLTPGQVESAAEVPHDVPLATVDLSAIQARVEDLAPVRSVDVSRSWPHSVLITVQERQPVAFVARDGGYRGVDESGVLFTSYPQRPTDLPEIQMQATTPVDALAEGAAVIAAMPQDLVQRVGYVDVRSIDNITLHLERGATVTWGSADQSGDKARVLAVLLAQKAKAYDVTAPGHPTIRR
jgi:cell division protein FtsQ